MSTTEDLTIVPSSGNIYVDLGLPNPEERRTKAELARQIDAILAERKLTQRAAAGLLGIPQPKVSNLLNGRLGGFSVERLMAFLTALNRDVQSTGARSRWPCACGGGSLPAKSSVVARGHAP